MEGQSSSRSLDTDVRNLSLVLNVRDFKPASAVELPVRDHPKTLTRIEQ